MAHGHIPVREETRLVTYCRTCVHYRGLSAEAPLAAFTTLETCDAFPRGIPKLIYSCAWNHRNPFPGDHGIRYLQGAGARTDVCPPVEVPLTEATAARAVQALRAHRHAAERLH